MPRLLSSIYNAYLRAAENGYLKILRNWGKPDLIHAHVVLPGGWAASYLGNRYSVPVVLTEHSGPFTMHLNTNHTRKLALHTLRSMNKVVAVSPALVRRIQDFYFRDDIIVIGNLIRTRYFVPASKITPKGKVRKFLSVCGLSEQKGLFYLLKAGKILLERNLKSFELLIGGDGPEKARLEQMAKEIGISTRCRFLGSLSREEVRNWMQSCDVFVISSLHESFCIVLGEAMACGKPVIATRCGGPEFVVSSEAGILVRTANSTEIADAMEKFILGKTNYNQKKIRDSVVSRFGEKAFLKNISRLYNEVWS
jgi:glycosyltransferase involved in cell wall biosynthesis